MADVRVGAWAKLLITAQLVAAALPLALLAQFLSNAASVGFAADRELYPRDAVTAKPVYNILKSWRDPRGRVIAVWGLGDEEVSADSEVAALLATMASEGVQLRICSNRADQAVLPEGVPIVDDPIECAQGAHAILLMNEDDRFDDVSVAEAAAGMVGSLFIDLTGRSDGVAIDEAGLQTLAFGAQLGPPWLDPDLRYFADWLNEQVAEDEGILLVPVVPPGTVAGRGRWYLHLNRLCFPRRMYLEEPEEASGTSVQFRQWVLDWRERFRERRTRQYEPQTRALSKVVGSGPARSLSAPERAAIEANEIQWVLFYTMNIDFRLMDWELMSVEDALAGGTR